MRSPFYSTVIIGLFSMWQYESCATQARLRKSFKLFFSISSERWRILILARAYSKCGSCSMPIIALYTGNGILLQITSIAGRNLEAAIEVGSGRALWGESPETVRLAEEMLGNLKARQRAVVEMTYYEGLTAEEIACRLGESPHVVRHDLHRGLAALRAIFGNSHEKE